MMRCFRIPNKGRNAEEEEEEEEKSSPVRKEFRFAKGRSEEDNFMIKNGGLLLEGIISSCAVNFTSYRTFSKQQLQIATNNFAEDRVLPWGLFGGRLGFKGNLDDSEVIVKIWREEDSWDGNRQPYVITEVAVGLQMNNHKNALKLLGCCLETRLPTLVFEFAENGQLSDHIYEDAGRPLLSWESRLRIAIEVADTISYLHTGTSRPIIHRNIKPQNIFLDKHFITKLSGFGSSISIPLGETSVTTDHWIGTIGYMAPEFMMVGQYTVQVDVYGFAMVLFEILSGIKRFSKYDDEVSDGPVQRYLKAKILEGNDEQIMAYAELVLRCMVVNPEERPSMVEVAYELRRIKGIQPISQ